MLEQGQLFGGRYRISNLLARGGMGEVYLAEQELEGFSRPVVIKTLLPSLTERKDLARLFLEEAWLAAQLTHPNIVHVYDVGREDDLYFFVMEYLRGSTLAELMRQRRQQKRSCSPAFLAAVGGQVCAALQYAFTKTAPDGQPLRVVHRDISPPNILLTEDGVAKVLDFGIAKASNSSSCTRVGELKGKPSYMSPEQARGQPVDARSDLFSLGIVLWEAAAGCKLFCGANSAEIAAKVCQAPIAPLCTLVPGLPLDLAGIIGRALERDPARRFQSAGEMGRALEGVLYRLSAEGPQESVKAEFAASGGEPAAPAPGQAWGPGWLGEETGFRAPASPTGSSFAVPGAAPDLPCGPASLPARFDPPVLRIAADPAGRAPGVLGSGLKAEPASAPGPERRGRARLLALAGALLVASALGALWSFSRDGARERLATAPAAAKQLDPGVSPWIDEMKTVGARVSSVPEGALIWVDGKQTGKKTPAALELDTGRDHVIELRHPDCLTYSASLFAAPNNPIVLAARLVAGAKVSVKTVPPGADVEIDGVKRFESPGTSDALAIGTHVLFARLAFHVAERRELDVKDARPLALSIALARGAEVEVKSLPAGAQILVEGKETGLKTPATVSVPLGPKRRVGVRLEGFIPVTRLLPRLTEGTLRSVELKLVPVKQAALEKREAALQRELGEWEKQLAGLRKRLSGLVVKRSAGAELVLQREADAAERRVEDLEGELGEVREQLLAVSGQ